MAQAMTYHPVLLRTPIIYNSTFPRETRVARVPFNCNSVKLQQPSTDGKQSVSANSAAAAATRQVSLPRELNADKMPKHLALICDGNNRWGRENGMSGIQGLDAGVGNLKEVVKACIEWGIDVVSVYQFSFDNWKRAKDEVEASFDVFEKHLTQNRESIKSHNVQFSVIGEAHLFPERFLKLVKEVEEESRNNTGLKVVVAGGYSGRMDILGACKKVAQQVKEGTLEVEDIDEKCLESQLMTSNLPYPHADVMVRTSGEQRISNFYLWQLTYSELVFVPEKWPAFKPDVLKGALIQYQSRTRRYGGR